LIKQLPSLHLKLPDLGFKLQHLLAFLGDLEPVVRYSRQISMLPLLALPLDLCYLSSEVQLPEACVAPEQ